MNFLLMKLKKDIKNQHIYFLLFFIVFYFELQFSKIFSLAFIYFNPLYTNFEYGTCKQIAEKSLFSNLSYKFFYASKYIFKENCPSTNGYSEYRSKKIHNI